MNQILLHADSIVTNSVHYHMNQTLLQQKCILSHEPDPYIIHWTYFWQLQYILSHNSQPLSHPATSPDVDVAVSYVLLKKTGPTHK